MRKALSALTIGVLLLLPLQNSNAATPKAGSVCAKKGLTQNYNGKKFTCVASGNKLVWDKGVVIKPLAPTPTPTPTLSPTPTPTPTLSPTPTPTPTLSPTPTPTPTLSPTPTPTPTSSQSPAPISASDSPNANDSKVIPEFTEISVKGTGETTAELNFQAKGYRSYRLSVVLKSDPNGQEISSLPVINSSESNLTLKVDNLECGRANYYEIRVTIYSGVNGSGNTRTAGATLATTSACATPRPTPSSTFLDTYKSPSKKSLPVERCKIQEVSAIRAHMLANSPTGPQKVSGFPKTESVVASKGKINLLAIPIDWADLPGDSNVVSRIKPQLEAHSAWWKMVSYGKLTFDWNIYDKWIRLPGESKSYSVPFSEAYPQTTDFWGKVIATVDPLIDFTNVQVVIFILPSGQTIVKESVQETYPNGALKEFKTKEGNLLAFMTPGMYFDQWNTNYWSYWAHEMGHLIDFAHGGTGRDSGQFGAYDMMFSQDGPTRELAGWWRFLADWLNSNQIYCDEFSNLSDLDLSLIPLNQSGDGIKLAVIRVSDTKVVVIESRRNSGFENINRTGFYQQKRSPSSWEGLLVYTYDATLGHLQNFFMPAASNEALSEYNFDGQTRYISKTGETIEVEGLKIKVTSSGNYDSVNISKLTANEIAKPRPSPSPAPLPSVSDFNTAPEVFGGAVRTSASTGVSTWYGQYFRSYRIYVVSASNPAETPMFDTGIVNGYQSPIKVNLSQLTCKRDEMEIAIFYSGLDGTGKITRIEQSAALSANTINREGKCVGYFNSNGA